jgi:hypothetical protein
MAGGKWQAHHDIEGDKGTHPDMGQAARAMLSPEPLEKPKRPKAEPKPEPVGPPKITRIAYPEGEKPISGDPKLMTGRYHPSQWKYQRKAKAKIQQYDVASHSEEISPGVHQVHVKDKPVGHVTQSGAGFTAHHERLGHQEQIHPDFKTASRALIKLHRAYEKNPAAFSTPTNPQPPKANPDSHVKVNDELRYFQKHKSYGTKYVMYREKYIGKVVQSPKGDWVAHHNELGAGEHRRWDHPTVAAMELKAVHLAGKHSEETHPPAPVVKKAEPINYLEPKKEAPKPAPKKDLGGPTQTLSLGQE